ncbi:MAG: hypothetical protein J6Y21_00135 [Clostridia bacterium]|nr:hypothetical protein [Clostridia bacterium]
MSPVITGGWTTIGSPVASGEEAAFFRRIDVVNTATADITNTAAITAAAIAVIALVLILPRTFLGPGFVSESVFLRRFSAFSTYLSSILLSASYNSLFFIVIPPDK